MVDELAVKICREFVKVIEEKLNIRVNKAILFGSRARDDWVEDSDIDLIIISNDWSRYRFSDRLGELYKLWSYPYDATLLAYTEEEFNYLVKEFTYFQEIASYGFVCYESE